MKTLLIIVLLCWVPYFHRKLLKWIPYRWCIGCLLYPVNLRRIKRRVNRINGRECVDLWFRLQDKWFTRYWFGKKLIAVVSESIEREVKVEL